MKKIWFAAACTIVYSASAAEAETYRLVHSLGEAEQVAAKGLSLEECERRKAELKTVAAALGTYNEASGIGSITCLPESLFEG